MKKKVWDVVVIGSGPAGLTAAIYTTRGALSTLIFGGEAWGGQLMLTTTVDNFPGFTQGIQGPELMLSMRKQAERFGACFIEKNVEKVDFNRKPFRLTAANRVYKARSVIIATGAQTRWLNVPGEQKLIGHGISTCASCDAAFFKNKDTLVIGGGDSAMEEALTLTKFANSVVIVHRRDRLRASKIMQHRVFNNQKIKILWHSEVIEFQGKQRLTGVRIKNNQTSKISQLAIEGAFIAIGHIPTTNIFKDQVKLDKKGFVVVQGTKTAVSGVFAAGDVHDWHYKQAITGASFGCMAALDTLSFLDNLKRKGQNAPNA